jgi:hypothetical protein
MVNKTQKKNRTPLRGVSSPKPPQNPKIPKSQNPLSKDPNPKPQGLLPGKPSAQAVVAVSRLVPVAVSRPRPPGAVAPRTAAQSKKATTPPSAKHYHQSVRRYNCHAKDQRTIPKHCRAYRISQTH